MNKIIFNYLLIIIFLSGFASSGIAQVDEFQPFKLWISIGFKKKINKKWQIGYSQLQSFSGKPFELNYLQPKVKLSYKIKSRLYLQGGYKPVVVMDFQRNTLSMNHRFFTELKWNTKLSKKFRLQQIVNAEKSLTTGSKFKERFSYSNKIYYRNKKFPIGLKPFLTQKIYWYQGGRALQYYNAEGEASEKVAPNGLHAYRIMAGISMKPFKKMSLTVYFMNQREFNTSLFGSRDINVLNPNKNIINRKFNNYSLLGVSTSFNL